MRAFIVAGSPEARPPLGEAPAAHDLVVAADRGLLHAESWGWRVDMLVGDMDSLAENGAVPPRTMPAITAPAAKDETDLEMALNYALRRGATEIRICAASGGRIDHLLANVLLLTRGDLAGLDVAIVDGATTVRLLGDQGEIALEGAPGDLLSLVPVGVAAEGVWTEGLEYPLRHETLPPGSGRGVSNLFSGRKACVGLGHGLLLVSHIRRE